LPTSGVAHQRSARWFRGPFARWPRAADATLAVIIFLMSVFLKEAPHDSVVPRRIQDVPLVLLLVAPVVCTALYRRRRSPLIALGLALGGWVVTLGTDSADAGVAALIALYSTGRYGDDSRWTYAGLGAALAVINLDGFVHHTPIGNDVFGIVVVFGVWYVGRRLRLRAERAVQAEREQDAEARRIVTEERTRIARELHDVVAHRVSLMTVQAGAAKAVAVIDLEAAIRAMGAVEEAGREALEELRHLLGVLRPDTGPDGLGPQPGLADLTRLVAQVRAAGLDVTLVGEALPKDLVARVDLFAYRIVQEALTNALKHAGPGTRVEVRLSVENGGVAIEVLDDGRGGPLGPEPGGRGISGIGGHGIVGMRERSLLLGGTLEAGPRPDGGFRVAAHLPADGEPR
jgi:signal transduction histidine kinase